MNSSHFFCLSIIFTALTVSANAQDGSDAREAPPSAQQETLPEDDFSEVPPADNPFRKWRAAIDQQAQQTGGRAAGYGEYGGGGASPYGGGGASPYGGGSPYGSPTSPNMLFQQAVRQTVKRLAAASTEAEKRKLLDLVRAAFNERYERAIATRQQELDELEQRLQALRADLDHRREAQEKVVDVQVRTVELAGEGLVEPEANR